jgi:predicted DNA-binding transcriptional regulator AlpA
MTDKAQTRDRVWLPGRKVERRYDKSKTTIWRWTRDPQMNFPQPRKFGRLNHWDLSELEAWERRQATRRT